MPKLCSELSSDIFENFKILFKASQIDYVDMVLIHWPFGTFGVCKEDNFPLKQHPITGVRGSGQIEGICDM